MGSRNSAKVFQVVNPICCGLDIHKVMISACLLYTDESGKAQEELREFGTITDDLINLREWLLERGCPIVAMESTGIYWRPIHNVLEGYVKVVLVNARHIKNVPGRKTDTADSKWLSGLLCFGLVKSSFIPPKQVRQWRDITTMRKNYVESASDFKKRIQKVLETANIKIDSVVSDLFGVSGRNLILDVQVFAFRQRQRFGYP
ncbi:MAG: transposase [Deltaproteobacteria bacterium]|nr:transposase [Deltaproteobacteria bacterium]